MTNLGTVSIIVPIYNAEKLLNRCIDSIVAQTNPNWELLLIDDGSPDGSGVICDEYAQKDARIKVFHKPNGGVSSARNVGLDNAKGEWITFIDADDYVDSTFCEFQVTDDCDIIIKPNSIVGLDLSQAEPIVKNIDKSCIEEYLSNNLSAKEYRVPWGKFIKASVIKNIRFPLNQRIGEDTVFMLMILAQTHRIQYDVVGCYYWQKGETTDSVKYRLSCDESVRFASEILDKYESSNIQCPKFEYFVLSYFFDLMDKSRMINIRNYFSATSINKYFRKLKKEGVLTISFRLWKSMPLCHSIYTRLKK